MVFWIYSGCLISFFTFVPGGSPINFISDFKDSPMTFYLQRVLNHGIKDVLNEPTLPKSISTNRLISEVLKDMASGKEGLGVIADRQVWRNLVSKSMYITLYSAFMYF